MDDDDDDGGTEQQDCGSACPATCADPEAERKCTKQCVEGPQCKEGLLLTEDGCVLPEQCGCTMNGIYYAVSRMTRLTIRDVWFAWRTEYQGSSWLAPLVKH